MWLRIWYQFTLFDLHWCIIRSVYIVYTVLGDVSIYVVGKDEYDELACKYS